MLYSSSVLEHSVWYSVCMPVQNVLADLPQHVRGHADDTKCVFILNTIYPCLMGPNG